MEDAVSQEKLLEKYIREAKKAPAVKLLTDLIARHAQMNDFSKADALREKLFEVDSLAVAEIVKSAEIIETAKIAAIDQKLTGARSSVTAPSRKTFFCGR